MPSRANLPGLSTAAGEIVVACPNLSLDRTIEIDRLQVGHVHRSATADARAGGKGVNVVRALSHIGHPARVVGFVAGNTGDAVAGALADEGLESTLVWVQGETRSCLTVLSGSEATVFNESGPRVDDGRWTGFEKAVGEQMRHACLFICSGSFPPGVPDDGAARLVDAARSHGLRALCDVSRAQLREVLRADPDLVAPNLSEAAEVLHGESGERVDPSGESLSAARGSAPRLRKMGLRNVLVTAGSSGAVLAQPEGLTTFIPPEIELVNPIGAGDCLMAGIGAGISSELSLVDATRIGMAMAAAGCETFAAGDVDPERAASLYDGVGVEPG